MGDHDCVISRNEQLDCLIVECRCGWTKGGMFSKQTALKWARAHQNKEAGL